MPSKNHLTDISHVCFDSCSCIASDFITIVIKWHPIRIHVWQLLWTACRIDMVDALSLLSFLSFPLVPEGVSVPAVGLQWHVLNVSFQTEAVTAVLFGVIFISCSNWQLWLSVDEGFWVLLGLGWPGTLGKHAHVGQMLLFVVTIVTGRWKPRALISPRQ